MKNKSRKTKQTELSIAEIENTSALIESKKIALSSLSTKLHAIKKIKENEIERLNDRKRELTAVEVSDSDNTHQKRRENKIIETSKKDAEIVEESFKNNLLSHVEQTISKTESFLIEEHDNLLSELNSL